MSKIWCQFELADDEACFGLVEGDTVTEVEGSPFKKYTLTDRKHKLDAIKLLPPVYPGNFYAIGSNYLANVSGKGAPKIPDSPKVGYRANSALTGQGDNIVKPADSGPKFQYEGELVAVIGKKMKNVEPAEAMAGVFGWTIGNDLTERNWNAIDSSNIRGKNSDTFKPMGPWIVTDLDIELMVTKVHLNGETVHEFSTANMLFRPDVVISAISRYNTLYPGDVVWLGTDEIPKDLVPGDLIEIEISGIGTLSNKVVAG